ncbi:hypothetical protein [Phenylobacterium sp.]|uniref:hypothetical protein n=1 Tax=Phenylobacterium sp. TaxID=1871053 RepID=UPI0011F777F7|nr:hypothetical protein [Phenylobacterium sp.]THD63006.1 MAG: hypothetical protein E8A49_06555 [Phenylobacterium sp.]
MTSTFEPRAHSAAWRDDIATPVTPPRLADILRAPHDAFSRPEWLARHVSLSPDEKRVALCAWLHALLVEGRDGLLSAEAAPALAELDRVDPGAAGVFRRALAASGLALVS